MLEKMYLADHYLTRTGRTRYTESMNIAVFSCINLLKSKQKTLSKQGCTKKIHVVND